MKLDFIALDKLVVSQTNMRYAKKAPDVTDILPSVRKRGVLQPVIVRPNCAPDSYEIIAGARRFTAAMIVADERRAAGGEIDPQATMLPCAILDGGDDADAVEASLIENIARLDADEVAQWETFTRLVKEGRSIDDIAATFGLPDLAIRRVLALGNLLPRIRALYAKEQIDRVTVRHLTLASKSQQKAWLALAGDAEAYLPTGHQLKAWLFGGQSVPVAHALFDIEASGLATIADLFGEDRYFADSDAFWTAQNAAIEERRAGYISAGWADAVVVGPDQYFSSWEYDKQGKRRGGRVYFDVRSSGEVVIHEGYISAKEAARIARGESGTDHKVPRPEITATMATYVDLHRHAAVRAALTGHPGVALRLMVAHAIGGSPLWTVRPEPQATRNDDVRDSVDNSKAEADFDERRRAVLALLDFDDDAPTVTGGNGDEYNLVGLFGRLLDLPDAVVFEVIAIVMGETLASGSAAVEAVGVQVGVDMADYWQADDAFFALLRDKEVLTRIVAEVAGEAVADANKAEKTKAMKQIVRDRLDGANGRERLERWVPRWMALPPSAYTERGGVGTVIAAVKAGAALDADDGQAPDPAAPASGAALPDEDGAAADEEAVRLAA
ncbi:ParB/RepB/Spo0J family partition protein [Sphingomonas koreensis]|nr:ParB/RepB/Spo0J family partition protein [Sphingomonas koreensis]